MNVFLFVKYTDRTVPVDKHVSVLAETHGISPVPITPQMFGNAGREHMAKYGKCGLLVLRLENVATSVLLQFSSFVVLIVLDIFFLRNKTRTFRENCI